ncbi:MAG TPA: FAD-binding oxidoreductase [Burkholderiaceae bacterium]|nr:FAD-binding oxidoreductase [Burkholderiaceae bacterium]
MQPSVVIVGGGVMGAATACFLARDHGAAVTVLEREPGYARASSALSASSIRQQFSTPVNIALSQASLAFLRHATDELAVAGEAPPALGLVEAGYLYLVGDAGVAAQRELNAVQRNHGADVRLFDGDALRARWPWLDTGGIALGSWGAAGEGWFDGPALHAAFRRKARACGVRFATAEAVAFDTRHERVRAVLAADGARFEADELVLTAGAWTAPLAARLGLPLPIAPKKRDVFVLESPAALPGCPLLIDPSGVWMRPEGPLFLAGMPPRDGDPDEPPLDAIDHALFDDLIWPALAARIPAFEALRVRTAWAGYYEMNAFDHNGVVGALPGWANAHVAAGFSGHGMQHAPAVGRGLARWVAERRWGAVDLTPLAPQRLTRGEPLRERNVI